MNIIARFFTLPSDNYIPTQKIASLFARLFFLPPNWSVGSITSSFFPQNKKVLGVSKGRGKAVVSLRGSEFLEGVRRIFVFWVSFFSRPSRNSNPTRSSGFPSLISAFGGRYANARSWHVLLWHSSLYHIMQGRRKGAHARTVACKCFASLH